MRRLLTGLLGASLLLGACSDDGDDDRAAVTSIPDQTTSTTTTTEKPAVPPPDMIPTDTSLITEEYVEQVLDALFELDLQAVELTEVEGTVGEGAIAVLEATTTEDALPQRINDLIDLASTGFAGMRDQPRPVDYEVLDVLERATYCVVAEVRADSTGMFPDSTIPDGAREFVRLYSATKEQRASGLNNTAWVIDELPVTLDGSVPTLICAPRN